jgi:hypothetical protein
MHRTTDRFWKCFEKLPLYIQSLAEDNFELLKKIHGIPHYTSRR